LGLPRDNPVYHVPAAEYSEFRQPEVPGVQSIIPAGGGPDVIQPVTAVLAVTRPQSNIFASDQRSQHLFCSEQTISHAACTVREREFLCLG
jgi:hypothetical protein